MPAIDITGQRFGRLVVIKRGTNRSKVSRAAAWRCLCDCGVEKVISGASLRQGLTKSCGCWNAEVLRDPERIALMHRGAHRLEIRARAQRSFAELMDARTDLNIENSPGGFKANGHYGGKIGRNVSLGTFSSIDEARLAVRQYRIDNGQSLLKDDGSIRVYEIGHEQGHVAQGPRRIKANSNFPNVSFDGRNPFRPWCAEVSHQKRLHRFHRAFETELEAALWAVEKKLELGHGPTAVLEARRERIMELMEAA
jgi:hypothetical protein